VECGFWEPATNGDHQFLSWDEYQRTKDKVLEERAKGRDRLAAWRASQKSA
jgi:hypothetical protein